MLRERQLCTELTAVRRSADWRDKVSDYAGDVAGLPRESMPWVETICSSGCPSFLLNAVIYFTPSDDLRDSPVRVRSPSLSAVAHRPALAAGQICGRADAALRRRFHNKKAAIGRLILERIGS